MSYSIIRMYYSGGHRKVDSGLTLEEAQSHCRGLEASSKTATSAVARRRTKRRGAWFDGYEED